jgi:membrane fusion protein, multidrug efflux system
LKSGSGSRQAFAAQRNAGAFRYEALSQDFSFSRLEVINLGSNVLLGYYLTMSIAPTKAVPMPGRHRLIAAGLVLLLIGGGFWLRRGLAQSDVRPSGSSQASAVPVTIAPAVRKDVEIGLNAIGTVTPVSMVTITSRVTGVLTEVHYVEGQIVKQNDLLAVIDPRPYQAALVQAQGQLERDQALLANARIDLERYRTAYQQHAISEQQVATQEANVRGTEGTVKLDQGSLDAAQVNVDYTRILSPIDGRVGLRMIDAGNIVEANGAKGLVTVAQLRPITVIFTLAQDFLPDVKKEIRGGQPIRVDAFDSTHKQPVARGTLLTIDNQIDPTTGTMRLKGVFPNDDDALWPGEFVNLRLIVGVRENAVTVPARAVQNGPNGSYLFVVKPDMTVEMRDVVVSQSEPDIAVIEKGLSENERVVVDGQYRLEQGTRVVLQSPAAPTGS